MSSQEQPFVLYVDTKQEKTELLIKMSFFILSSTSYIETKAGNIVCKYVNNNDSGYASSMLCVIAFWNVRPKFVAFSNFSINQISTDIIIIIIINN